ncbi:MAG: GNAT family N-acetyltransferase [Flavobacteriaceae bacterium]|nr:GNAT family N-acetyltransferase [Flavobacteriaceae bacterium]
MKIRPALHSDLDTIRSLFYDVITTVNVNDYSPEEIKVWASGAEDVERWKKKLSDQEFFVCEISEEIVGFTSLLNQNYIDHLYVSQHHQGLGIASKLLSFIESKVKVYGTQKVKSDVSITARPFFEHKGYQVVKRNEIQHKGEVLINFDVIKELS